ncbi:hypothetical protein FAZ19_07075 [Sphingobacterium alkalisoli]|uniref:DUF4252 domain-containing protein n=1 Tax=Sphingobacterium alkalisoli TaxID=1874115 RepID=A0A4U0H4N4_9SPHI|nr:hypothetical protein [Sphingobacterium alkalisoli]TJY66673.1 hypothetical protein FAZ19_07075 [Sphingobacterium alkalisoli]GGH14893.1 hypothetical protein GCM10011418_16190 [Sphingobacterium alkalisoli]
MKQLALTILAIFSCLLNYAQSPPERVAEKLEKKPIIFIDSIRVDIVEMQKYNADQIAAVTVYKDSVTLGIFGNTTDGVVYIETKDFSRKRFINYFKSKSIEFKQLLESLENDNSFQYILNGKVLAENYEGNLAAIDDKIFRSLTIIDKKELTSKYENTSKDFGILIASDVPENLYDGKNKF